MKRTIFMCKRVANCVFCGAPAKWHCGHVHDASGSDTLSAGACEEHSDAMGTIAGLPIGARVCSPGTPYWHACYGAWSQRYGVTGDPIEIDE